MMNWIYYKLAMYYLRKAGKIKDIIRDFEKWDYYMQESKKWINRVGL